MGEAPKGFSWQTITPQVSKFAFRVLMPDDFQVLQLPPKSPDFSNPTQMMPLGVLMAKYGAVVFSAATRPVFSDGTVADWLLYFAKAQEATQFEDIVESKVGEIPCVACFATQPSDAGPMRLRTSCFEDGGMIYNVSVMAPQALWDSVQKTFITMVNSFELVNREGPRAPLHAGVAAQSNASASAASEPARDKDDHMTRAMDLAGLILRDLKFAGE